MATAQPIYDYSTYDYSYEASSAAAYSSYPGYESNASYTVPAPYDGYATSGSYSTDAATGSSYTTADPYSGYPAAAYGYPAAAAASAPSSTTSQNGYPSSYSSSPSNSSQAYNSTRGTPPPSSSAAATHYAGYNYTSNMTGGYVPTPSSNVYSTYATSAQGYPPSSDMIPQQLDYYHSNQVPHMMHYVHRQPQRLPYRLPPRGGYQRELDEPGDENALLRHVIYITGLPKEIQNETLAEVFSATCGPIAPVDVRSPKPKIWVYKDRQTREGKGEATITFISPESCHMAINYYNGKELFGREIRVALCPRRMYNMQKQNTPFNPAAPPNHTNISMTKSISTNNNAVTIVNAMPAISAISTDAASLASSSVPMAAITSSNTSTTANPITTISSSTIGLSRQLNHSLFKIRQTSEQQRGLLPTPAGSYNALQRDGGRKELPRVAFNKSNTSNPVGVRPKPY